MCVMAGPNFDRAVLKTMIFSAYQDLPETPVRAIYQRACEVFIADPNIPKLIEALANRVTPLRRDELTHTLRALHPFALSVLLKQWRREGIDGFFRDLDALHTNAEAMNEAIARVAAMKPPEQEAAEVIFSASELMAAQMELIQDYNNPPPPEAQALIFATRDFPVRYVQALDELIHPLCFATCFVANPADASMRGTYGDSHTGVCLKFKTAADVEGQPALNLNGITGWRGGTGMAPEPFRSFHPRSFYKVNYSESYPEIDFFNSLGRLPIPLLNAVWYTDAGGERSTCHSVRSLDTDTWRQKYWEACRTASAVQAYYLTHSPMVVRTELTLYARFWHVPSAFSAYSAKGDTGFANRIRAKLLVRSNFLRLTRFHLAGKCSRPSRKARHRCRAFLIEPALNGWT
jgi:hypothetical protein